MEELAGRFFFGNEFHSKAADFDCFFHCLPNFGHDKNILTLHNALLDGFCKTLANFGFVAVAVCAIEQTVADFQGMVDTFSYNAWGSLPCAWENIM